MRQLLSVSLAAILATHLHTSALATTSSPAKAPSTDGVSVALFSSLERLSRLVDIAYCVGVSGVSHPFSCASRCKEFPTLELVTTWNTGALMTDSCGYIALDHENGTDHEANYDAGKKGKGSIIVAFRGTYSLTNTIIDLSTIPQKYVPYPDPDPDDPDKDPKDPKRPVCSNCTVHMGFLASWKSAREYVLPALEQARKEYPGYKLRLVGHSLGGAVTALAALELRLVHGWEDVQITTFGEPRLGNQGLADFVDDVFGLAEKEDREPEERVYRRMTHADDPVPLLPLSEWGYVSHGGEIYISKASLPPAPEDLRMCRGQADGNCLDDSAADDNGAGWMDRLLPSLVEQEASGADDDEAASLSGIPTRLKLWQLFFAHRDYFWRIGLCVPGGDPSDWGRERYNYTTTTAGANWGREDEL